MVLESVMNFFEVILLYRILVVIDPRNIMSLKKLVLAAILAVIMTKIVDYFDLPFYLLFTTMIQIFIFYLFTSCRLLNVFSDVLVAVIITGLLQLSIMVIISYINSSLLNDYIFIPFLIAFIILFFFIGRISSLNLLIHDYYQIKRKIYLFCCINIVLLFSIISNIFESEEHQFWSNSTNLTLIIVSYILINIMIIVLLFYALKEKYEKSYYIDFSNGLKDMVDKLSHSKHEYANHLNAILAFNKKSNDAEIRSVIENYINGIFDRSKRTDIVDADNNSIIEMILRYHGKNAANFGIKFDYNIDKETNSYGIAQTELIEILSNLLNNAIESVIRLPEKKRYIKINFNNNEFTIINSIERTLSDREITMFFIEGYSTKEIGGGKGLTNIKKITRDNNIQLKTESIDKEYIVRLVFPRINETDLS